MSLRLQSIGLHVGLGLFLLGFLVWPQVFRGDQWFIWGAVTVIGPVVVGGLIGRRIDRVRDFRERDLREKQALAVLIHARYILASGWVQDEWLDEYPGAAEDANGDYVHPKDARAVKWSVKGALAMANAATLVPGLGAISDRDPWTAGALNVDIPSILSDCLPVEWLDPGSVFQVYEYVSDPETTHTDVLAVFDAAIHQELARRSQSQLQRRYR